MAFSTTHAAAEFVSTGYMGARGIYTTKRKYSMSDLIVWQERNWNKFDNILRQEANTITVSDPEPKVLTKQEAPIKFDVATDSTTTTLGDDTLIISDTLAKFLQPGDKLVCNQIFCDSDGAAFSTDKFEEVSSVILKPEMMIVDSVTLSGTASGYSKTIVSRGNGADPATSYTCYSEYKLIKVGSILEDGGDAATVKWHEPNVAQNYCEIMSKTWGETETEENMDVYGKETMPQKAQRKKKEFFREVDASLIWGRKAKDVFNGQTRWFTGGVVEIIPGSGTALDGTSRFIDFAGAFDLETWREKMEIVFKYGSETKAALCGGKFFTVLYNNLEKFIVANDTLSKKWGFQVFTLETGHGLLNLLRHPLYSEMDTSNQAYAYDSLIVDLEYVALMKMKGMDVKIKTSVQDNDEHGQVNEVYAQLGLQRLHPTSHAYIHGITG